MVTDGSIHPDDEIYGTKPVARPTFCKSTFKCPVCGTYFSKVWTKHSADDESAIRIRKCENGHKFRTKETIVPEKS